MIPKNTLPGALRVPFWARLGPLFGSGFLSNCPKLQAVNFEKCENLEDASAEHLAKCPLLRIVNLERCSKLTDGAVRHLATLPRLESVSLGGCRGLSDAAAEYLAACPALRIVAFGRCDGLTWPSGDVDEAGGSTSSFVRGNPDGGAGGCTGGATGGAAGVAAALAGFFGVVRALSVRLSIFAEVASIAGA